jgi:hypothetical protein
VGTRRYELKQPDLNRAVEDLVGRAQEIYGEHGGADFVRQILVTGVRLLRDGADAGDLKLLSNALKELVRRTPSPSASFAPAGWSSREPARGSWRPPRAARAVIPPSA